MLYHFPLDLPRNILLTKVLCSYIQELDGVGPGDKGPSNDKPHHFVRKKEEEKKCDTWYVTRDMWLVTCDTWHVTCDTLHVWGGGWAFSQNVSSLALTVCDLWYYEDLEEKDEIMNESINEWIN